MCRYSRQITAFRYTHTLKNLLYYLNRKFTTWKMTLEKLKNLAQNAGRSADIDLCWLARLVRKYTIILFGRGICCNLWLSVSRL